MSLEKERVTLLEERLREPVCKRDEEPLVFAMERRNIVNRSRRREIKTAATIVAATEKRTSRAGRLHAFVPLEKTSSPHCIQSLSDPSERKLIVAHELNARIVDTVRRDGYLPLASRHDPPRPGQM